MDNLRRNGGWWRPARYLARAELRRRAGASLALVLMLGTVVGLAMAAVSAGRRGPDAFERFVDASRPGHASVFLFEKDRLDELENEVARADGVTAAAARTFTMMATVGPDDRIDTKGVLGGLVYLGGDPAIERPSVLQGQFPKRPFELAVNEAFATRLGLQPGNRVRLAVYSSEQTDEVALDAGSQPAHGVHWFTVTAIARAPADLEFQADAQPGTVYEREAEAAWYPGALWEHFGGDLPNYGVGVIAELDGDQGLRSLRELVEGPFAGESDFEEGGEDSGQHDAISRVIRLQSAALYGFAAIVGVVMAVAGGLAVVRHLVTGSLAAPAVLAMGASRPMLAGASLVWGFTVGLAAAAVAVAVAFALSAVGPVGVARRAELDLGLRLDPTVSVLGAAATVALVAAPAFLAGRRLHRRRAPVAREPASLPATVARLGAGPGPVVGAWLATGRQGEDGRVPTRTALLGVLAAVVGATAAFTFGVSLTNVTTSPEAYGWAWDVAVSNCSDARCSDEVAGKLRRNDDVAAYTGIAGGGGTIDAVDLPELGIAFLGRGWAGGRILAGRPPSGDADVVVATGTLETLDKQIGDVVDLAIEGGRPARFTIVGEYIPPALFSDGLTLDEGATISRDGALRAAPERLHGVLAEIGANQHLVTLAPTADEEEALRRLRADFPGTVLLPFRTDSLEGAYRLRWLPMVLAGVVALVAVATLVHLGAATARRRASALGVIAALGAARSHLRAALRWQAVLIAAGAVVVGVPAGVVLGRALCRLAGHGLDTIVAPTLPVLGLVAVVSTCLAAAAGIGTLFGRVAARRSTAALLRD